MKNFPSSLRSLCLLVLGVLISSVAFGEGAAPTVTYTPRDQTVEGDAPLFWFHSVTVRAPSNIASKIAQYNTANPTTPITSIIPTLEWTVISAPPGVDDATALSYVSYFYLPDDSVMPSIWLDTGENKIDTIVQPWISSQYTQYGPAPSVLAYASPSDKHAIGIYFRGPENSVAGNYAYRLRFTGFPGEPVDPTGVGETLNNATYINVDLQNPLNQGDPPIVGIASPADQQEFVYVVGGAPVQVPIQATGEATSEAPVTELTLAVSDRGTLGSPDVTVTNLNTDYASASATLGYTLAGTYTVTATAKNLYGDALTTTDFIIKRTVPAPTIAIREPLPPSVHVYTYTLGLESGVAVPYTIDAATLADGGTDEGIKTLTATETLASSPDSVTLTGWNLGDLAVTGSATRTISAPGTYTVVAKTSTVHGEATATSTFQVATILPAPTVAITSPANGATFTRISGSPASSIPFTFQGGVAYGNITAITVTITDSHGQPASFTYSSSGLNTGTISGSGTISTAVEDTFTIEVGVTSAGGTASDSVALSVNEIASAPPRITIDAPVTGSSYSFTFGGPGATVPVQVSTDTDFGTIQSVSATLGTTNGQSLPLSLTGLGTTAATGTYSGLVISTPGPYTINARSDTLYGFATTSTSFTVVGLYPAPVVTITSPADGSEYTRFESDAPTQIPFTYTASVSYGSITDLLVTVNGQPVTTTHSNLGQATITGSGVVSSSETASYPIVVTATTDQGKSDFDGITVNVLEKSDPNGDENPVATVCWQQPISSGTVFCGGDKVAIKFKLTTGTCTAVTDSAVVIAVTDEATGQSWLYASGASADGNTYLLDGSCYLKNFVTADGNHQYRVEVYRPKYVGGSEMVLLGSKIFATKADCGCGSHKSGKSDKSDKSGKSGKSDHCDKSGKSDKSSKSSPCDYDWFGRCKKKGQWGHNCDANKGGNWAQSSKSDKSGSSHSSSCEFNWRGECTKKGQKGHTCQQSSGKSSKSWGSSNSSSGWNPFGWWG